MPINTVRNYLNGQSHGPNQYDVGSVRPNWFNLYERDNNGENIHPYHLYIRYDSIERYFYVSVYYGGRANWQANFANATNQLANIQQSMQNDARWANICYVLNNSANLVPVQAGRDPNNPRYFEYKIKNPNDDLPPTQAQLDVIKKLVDLLFEKF